MPDLNDAHLNGTGRPIRGRGARIVAYYALFASLWILFSDGLLGLLVPDPRLMTRIAMLKGWAFVAITSLLLFFLIRRMLDDIDGAHSGREKALLAIVDDIARRKKAEEALKENAHFLQILIDAIPNPIFYKDINCVYQGCNAAFEAYLGLDKSRIVGSSAYDLAPKELADRYYEMDRTLLFQGGVQVYESSVRYADGTLHDVIFNKATYSNTDGSLGGIVGVILDISERKRAEEMTREANERFRTVLRAATAYSIIGTEPDGIITVFNEGSELMLGYKASEVIGKVTPGILHDPDEVAARAAELGITPGFEVFVAAARQGETETREWTYIRKDGSRLTVSLTVTAMRSEDGELTGFIGIASDITEQKKADEELAQYRDQLENIVEERTAQLEVAIENLSAARDAANAANQAKSMFLANMSHEIRTPMNAVLGFAQLLERDPSLSPQARNKVATIMKSGEHLLAIINDILEMSRIEAGRVEVRTQPVDLHGLLDDLAVMFRLRAEEKGVAFSLDSAPDLPRYIVADLSKLRQVLINLLGNAVKFTRAGSIELRAFPAGPGRIAVEVQDSGIGITPEEQEKLFRPFERTRSGEQAAGGTGLGLAISREYALLMSGDITVASVAGEGSCFRFEFHAPATSIMPPHEVSRHVTGLAPGQGELSEPAAESPPVQTIPSLDKMPPEWREALKQALARKNITRVRKLGEEAKKIDPLLSEWVLERAGVYDMDGLKKLVEENF